jgi:hypothetical protein
MIGVKGNGKSNVFAYLAGDDHKNRILDAIDSDNGGFEVYVYEYCIERGESFSKVWNDNDYVIELWEDYHAN